MRACTVCTESKPADLRTTNSQVGGSFTALYVMLEQVRGLGGFSSQVSLRVCPALWSAFFSFFSRAGIFSVRRAQGSHPNPLVGAAPLHTPPASARSHRLNVVLKPALLDMDQLIGSAALLLLSFTSVRPWLMRSPTISRARLP
jgi:hypothetical protein